MIIVASQRGGAAQLGLHLLNVEDNEHVELHEISGFVADDVVGAFKEAQAVSKGTQCRQFLFSVSFNPPEGSYVEIAAFEDAISRVEKQNGLTGQPRVIVFHEKEGRRHAHCVWSRIDAETMTARPLPFFKRKIMDISRDLYREHGWEMPRGLEDDRLTDRRNFTLAEWQQAKRAGYHARDLKQLIQNAWRRSDNAASFTAALAEHDLKLAKGDRRGHVIVTHEGEVLSASRYIGVKQKEIAAAIGKPDALPSVENAKALFAEEDRNGFRDHLKATLEQSAQILRPLIRGRRDMTVRHREQRIDLAACHKERDERDQLERAARFAKGIRGVWEWMTGKRCKIAESNAQEAEAAKLRDQREAEALRKQQLSKRKILQDAFKQERVRAIDARVRSRRALHELDGASGLEAPASRSGDRTRAGKTLETERGNALDLNRTTSAGYGKPDGPDLEI
ncbi:relaxase/mobilization nuclease domain-containing protein [Parvularcula marina]|nr:relaxase/mobilization nuclease domain-containing protein [Parvularcula marina]